MRLYLIRVLCVYQEYRLYCLYISDKRIGSQHLNTSKILYASIGRRDEQKTFTAAQKLCGSASNMAATACSCAYLWTMG